MFEETLRSIATSVARFSSFTANALIFGMVPVLLLVLRPAFAAAGEGWDEGRRRVAVRLEGFFQASLMASGVATVIAIVLQAVLVSGATGGDVTMGAVDAVVSTPFGRWYLLRLPLLVGLAVLLGRSIDRWALAGTGGSERAPGIAWWCGWAGLSLPLLVTSTVTGHAIVARPYWISVVNDAVHLVAGATWITGIVIFAVILPDAWRGKEDPERLALLAPAVVRFSTVALVSVALLATTGAVNSLLHVGRLEDLVATGYGVALALKIGAFLGVLAIGGVNHFYIRRRFERAVSIGSSTSSARLFRRTIAIELTLAMLILGLTGVLTGLPRTKTVEPANAPAAVTRPAE